MGWNARIYAQHHAEDIQPRRQDIEEREESDWLILGEEVTVSRMVNGVGLCTHHDKVDDDVGARRDRRRNDRLPDQVHHLPQHTIRFGIETLLMNNQLVSCASRDDNIDCCQRKVGVLASRGKWRPGKEGVPTLAAREGIAREASVSVGTFEEADRLARTVALVG